MIGMCVVPHCNSGREETGKSIAFFDIPQNPELRGKWIAAISGTGVPWNSTGVICEKHFVESDVIRHYIIQDGAKNVGLKVAYDNPRLAETAVPSIFPNNKVEWTQPEVNCVRQSASPSASDVVSEITEGQDPEARSLIGRNHDNPRKANTRSAINQPTKPIGFEHYTLPITAQPQSIMIKPATGFVPANGIANRDRSNDDDSCYCCKAFCDDLNKCCGCRCCCCNQSCWDWLECCGNCLRCISACGEIMRN